MVKEILRENKTEDFWELSRFDAESWLRPLTEYLGWKDWLDKKYPKRLSKTEE